MFGCIPGTNKVQCYGVSWGTNSGLENKTRLLKLCLKTFKTSGDLSVGANGAEPKELPPY